MCLGWNYNYGLPRICAKSTGQITRIKLAGRFHKVSPNFRRAYDTLQNFAPDLQKFYTDISVISVTFCNSDCDMAAQNSMAVIAQLVTALVQIALYQHLYQDTQIDIYI